MIMRASSSKQSKNSPEKSSSKFWACFLIGASLVLPSAMVVNYLNGDSDLSESDALSNTSAPSASNSSCDQQAAIDDAKAITGETIDSEAEIYAATAIGKARGCY